MGHMHTAGNQPPECRNEECGKRGIMGCGKGFQQSEISKNYVCTEMNHSGRTMKKENEVDLKAIARDVMRKYGFSPDFPDAVVREAREMEENPPRGDRKDTRDLTGLLWSSIDNSDSMDLDQIEYCEGVSGDEVQVKVAIADVDYYVRKGSPADRHASHNGTSVYLGVETFPMLPDQLSKGISSLLPGGEKRAMVIEYGVLPDGTVRHGDIYRAVVQNRAKLVYEQVGEWLEGTGPVPETIMNVPGLEAQILLQAEVTRRLRARRMEQGALDLETLEAEAVMENGQVRELVVQRQNPARSIIEELMVAANQTMVKRLGDAGIPMIQRIVRVPKNWDGIVGTAAEYGTHLPADPDSKALAIFLDRRREADPERFPDLSLTIVKLMGPGEYVAYTPGDVPIGHFALAVMDYTHSTAPNRRYVDIINQRLLKSVLDNKPVPYRKKELDELASWLTDRDKSSQKAERFMLKSAAAVLLKDSIGDIFDAIVTGAAEKGTYVRLISPPVEGRVMKGEYGLKVGQKVVVRLLSTNPWKGYIDFECTDRKRR
jgi:Exoribonuclease R